MEGVDLGLLAATVIVLLVSCISWTAGRLDRLHVRVEAARAALDAQLLRRAAVAGELADAARAAGLVPAATAAGLADAARAARRPDPTDREGIENDLTRALRAVLDALPDPATPAGAHPGVARVRRDLESASTRVGLARSFHNGAVEDTRALRAGLLVRWLRLAGHAPLPAYFEIDDGLHAPVLPAQRTPAQVRTDADA